MLVSLKWLKEYVDVNIDPMDFADAMTMSGTKVETVEAISEDVDGVVIGKIVKKEKHPDADKLWVLTIDIAKGEPLTIITSAGNVFEGAVVPVAVAGSTIAGGQKMADTEFRGITSQGMLCSVEELGMNTDLFSQEVRDGIYILPEDTEIGVQAKDLLWIDDLVYDFELTANRGDCQSVYGIAREAAATLGESIKPVALYDYDEEMNAVEEFLTVAVETELCPRYVAKMLKVKKIEPSPLWMQVKLLNSGVRPLNNVVDVTNYVMLELGQPLHAFDYKSLGTKAIVVKTGNPEKTVVTLDDKERAIDPEMMMITNGEHPVAVAGVMGGANSEITEDTEYVVLESACFDKTSIRLTSKKLGLRTEASGRYEKGIYPNLAMEAALRATKLFEEIGACEAIEGIIDVYQNPTSERTITVDCDWINRFIGIDLTVDEIASIFERLFLTVERGEGAMLTVTVPDYRQDLEVPEDLAEEVARIFGYDKIPNTIMGGTTLVGGKTDKQKFKDAIRQDLIGAGYFETLTTSFTSLNKLSVFMENAAEEAVILMNPLGEETSVMRPNMMGHHLEVIALNASRNNPQGRFFEIANTYHINEAKDELPLERAHLTISGYGGMDYFDLKGAVELVVETLGLTERIDYVTGAIPVYHPGRSASITLDGEIIGYLGQIHPAVCKKMDLPGDTHVCEVDFAALLAVSAKEIKFRELPKYPGSVRDIAILVDRGVPAAEIQKVIADRDSDIIESINLFDVYTGERIAADKKSLAYSIAFRHPERTLTDEEINPVMEAIVADLANAFGAQLRD